MSNKTLERGKPPLPSNNELSTRLWGGGPPTFYAVGRMALIAGFSAIRSSISRVAAARL